MQVVVENSLNQLSHSELYIFAQCVLSNGCVLFCEIKDSNILLKQDEEPEVRLTVYAAYSLGNAKPIMVPKDNVSNCRQCDGKFIKEKQKHYCRACGNVRRLYFNGLKSVDLRLLLIISEVLMELAEPFNWICLLHPAAEEDRSRTAQFKVTARTFNFCTYTSLLERDCAYESAVSVSL
jgi:hypothetical protein